MEISLVFQKHPSEDTWEEYALGRLSEPQTAPLEEHLLICDACQTTLANVDLYLRAFKAAAAPLPPVLPGLRRFRLLGPGIRLALATALAMALLAAILLVRRGPVEQPVFVTLASLRGGNGANPTRAPAHRPLILSVNTDDVAPAAEYRFEVVTSSGRQVWSTRVAPAGVRIAGQLAPGLDAGLYWVRLYGPDSALLSEFGLQLQ